VPGIQFEPDRSFDHARRIDQLLHDPRVAPDLARADESGGDTGSGSGA
jgi:hypothetical protein